MRAAIFLFLIAFLCARGDAAAIQTTDRLVLELGRAEIGAVIEIDGSLLDGALTGRVILERVALRAPGAEVYVLSGDGPEKLDYPRRHVFMGRGADDPAVRVGLLFDPVGMRLSGSVVSQRGMLSLGLASDAGWRVTTARVESLLPPGVELEQRCGNLDLDQSSRRPHFEPDVLDGVFSSAARGSLRYGVLALDTDIEWLDRRFGDDTTAAAEWFEDLLVSTNTLFESQLDLRMLQGDTFLRTSSDPYDVESSGASGSHLDEFGTHWQDNLGNIDRTHAALVSGNSSSGNSASGIAWVNSYCENQSFGGSYSVNQLFWNGGVLVAASARLFAHEIGHNLGSVHTHCYDPPVDQCWADETPAPPCFKGTPSCPQEDGQDVPGTLMSYCNRNGCGSNDFEFAPQVESRLRQDIGANTPSCISSEVGATVIYEDRFES